ncbi:MAG: protoglobin domain-containing protein [Pirellulales bacterium]|nr:protoglobin domain-containing protein [Pirellulales bacterium]
MTDFKQQLEFLELADADQQRLRSLKPAFAKFSEEFVEAFYAHLAEFEDTARLLSDEHTVARLKQLQLAHLESMLDADWDAAYVERRHRVGEAHADRGLEPEYFLGAYNQYIQFCFRNYAVQQGFEATEPLENLLSLVKAILLDVGLTLSAYFERSTQDLRKALDLYWQANTELRRFAELASHDLKTPLATMANLCDEAVDEFGDQMPAEAKQLVEQARQRSFRMSHMIDELLASAVIDRDEHRLGDVALNDVVREALDRLQPIASKSSIRIELAEDLPTVIGESVPLREAFYNLLSNAVKFIDPAKGVIRVDARRSEDEVTITIADNGPGIPKEELERIFAPFRRLASHHDRPGSGLGLYFTRSLIAQQGGRVWAESDGTSGSTFFIVLRAAG